jgi:segregation and condensation protein B
MTYDILIEALLFYRSSSVSKAQVANAIGISLEELPSHLATLKERLAAGATTIVETESEVQLVSAPYVSSFIDAVRRDELKTDIGKAGAETLAVVLYREPVTRAEIDQIRGVNSSVAIRNLQTRGLIERATEQKNAHAVYRITPQLLAHLGITHKQELPNYNTIIERIESFMGEPATNPSDS